MSLAELFACADGYARSQGAAEDPEAPSDERFDEILREIERQEQ